MEVDSSFPPAPPTAGAVTRTVDVIVAVSDDHTARVFHFSGGELQALVAASPLISTA